VRRGRRLRTGPLIAVALIAGVALLALGLGLAVTVPRPDAGAIPEGRLQARAVPENSASPRAAPRPSTLRPISLRLPDGTSAHVVPVALTADGALRPPSDVRVAGWWIGGAGLDSQVGTMVLAGHVDSLRQGLGVFSRLRTLNPGQLVSVYGADGAARRFSVVARRSYAKSAGLPASVFALDVRPRLVLITCAGRFDRRTHSYPDNLVVYAVPA